MKEEDDFIIYMMNKFYGSPYNKDCNIVADN